MFPPAPWVLSGADLAPWGAGLPTIDGSTGKTDSERYVVSALYYMLLVRKRQVTSRGPIHCVEGRRGGVWTSIPRRYHVHGNHCRRGFASGQETLKFFTAFGLDGFWGLLIATIGFCFYGILVMEMGRQLQAKSHREVLEWACGKRVGSVLDFIVTVFLFAILAIMIVGGAAVGAEQLGVPQSPAQCLRPGLRQPRYCRHARHHGGQFGGGSLPGAGSVGTLGSNHYGGSHAGVAYHRRALAGAGGGAPTGRWRPACTLGTTSCWPFRCWRRWAPR